MKKCTDCKWHLEEEYGYSNYTVEGIMIFCLKELNKSLPKDRWYSEDESLNFAEKCPKFIRSDSYAVVDVERESLPFRDKGKPFSYYYGLESDTEFNELLDKWWEEYGN